MKTGLDPSLPPHRLGIYFCAIPEASCLQGAPSRALNLCLSCQFSVAPLDLSPSSDTGTLLFLLHSAKMPFAAHGMWYPFSSSLMSRVLSIPHSEFGGQKECDCYFLGLLASVDVREWVAQAVMSERDLGPVQRGKLDRRGSRGGSGE